MAVQALPAFPDGIVRRIWWFVQCFAVRIPWQGVFLYGPQLCLGLSAAYASAQFAGHHKVFPFPFNVMIGVAFEWTYVGTLVVAGSHKDIIWYKVVNVIAVAASIIYVTLHASEMYGLLDSLTTPTWMLVFSLIHGVPLAFLNFVYGLLIHHYLRAVALEKAATKYKCTECDAAFPTPQARNGHMKTHAKD